MYIDVHTHRHYGEGNSDLMSVYNLFTHNSETPILNFEQYSIGMHPWHLGALPLPEQWWVLERYACYKEVCAIGECGLDKNASFSFLEQTKWFLQQARLAEDLRKPVLIHCVKSYNELLYLRRSSSWQQAWIVHGFRGSLQLAQELVRVGFYLSFGGSLLFENSKLPLVFQEIPLERVFLETDNALDLDIAHLYGFSARLRGMDLAAFSDALCHNAGECSLFLNFI